MKRVHYIVCSLCLAAIVSCGKGDEEPEAVKQGESPLTPYQELQLAVNRHDQFTKTKDKTALYEAEYHFANVAIRSDVHDSLRMRALYNLHNIEYHGAYGRTNYAKALMYINRCIEYAKTGATDSINLALFYAHKGDDLWHYGEVDSAIHYCHKATSFPVRLNSTDYNVSYELKHIYRDRNMPDSAAYYEQRFSHASKLPGYQLNRHNIHEPLSASEFEVEMKRTMEESLLLKATTPKKSTEEEEHLQTIPSTLPFRYASFCLPHSLYTYIISIARYQPRLSRKRPRRRSCSHQSPRRNAERPSLYPRHSYCGAHLPMANEPLSIRKVSTTSTRCR